MSVAHDFDDAPKDLAEYRLVEGGFPNRGEAEAAMFAYAEKIKAAGQTDRFGVTVRRMYVRNPGRAGDYKPIRSGWGVYVRDRACRS